MQLVSCALEIHSSFTPFEIRYLAQRHMPERW
jgi:hypothetical protein